MDNVKGTETLFVRALPLLFSIKVEVILEVTRVPSGSRRNYHSVLKGFGGDEESVFGFWWRKMVGRGGGGGGDVSVVFE